MKKRVLSVFMCCIMLLQLVALGIVAVSAEPESTESRPEGRLYTYNADKTKVICNGTEYAISDGSVTIDGTQWKLAEKITDMENMLKSSTNYLLMNDIALFDGKKEIAVNKNVSLMDYAVTGTAGKTDQFKGMIEGNGYAITGCDVTYTNKATTAAVYFSLFYYAGKSIRNLSFGTAESPIRLKGIFPDATNGASIGLVSPIMNSGTDAVLENINVYCDIDIYAPGVGLCFVAPFFSRNYSGKGNIQMLNVETHGSMKIKCGGTVGIGGICGSTFQTTGTCCISMNGCVNNINLTVEGSGLKANKNADSLVGGVIAGYTAGAGKLTLTSCLNNGSISFTGSADAARQYVGGLIGSANTTNQTIIQCANTGNVTATDTEPVGTTVTPAEAAYQLGKKFGYKLDGSEGGPSLGSKHYVTYDYNRNTYINTENVLSVTDSAVKDFSAQIQFAKSGDVNKLRFILVGYEESIENLGTFDVVLTFLYGGTTQTITVPQSELFAYRTVKAAGEMYYAEYGQCLMGFVVTNIPAEVTTSGTTVTAQLVMASGSEIALGNAAW